MDNEAKPLTSFTDQELANALINMRHKIKSVISGSNIDLKEFDKLGDSMRDLLKEREIRRECKEDMYRATDDAYRRWLKARADYGS